MRRSRFGPLPVEVPVIGQGSWEAERTWAGSVAALRRGLDLGLTHIDTAEMYGAGAAEELVGEAIAGRREEVFLVSKVLPVNASRQGTIEACHRSLRHLRTSFLDCYLLHSPSQHPFAETLAAFRELQQEGAIRAFGISNFHGDRLEEAVALAGPGAIACNQVPYHLRDRHIETTVLDACAGHGIAVVGYSPFGQGNFPAGDPVLAAVAAAHAATPRQVALAFLTRQPGLFAIPKASRPAHAEENAGGGDLVLTGEEIARIDAAFPR
jgi:diketogulonate reductase-like aldo/keto reductase